MKILEHILNTTIRHKISINNLQFGFISGRCSTDAISMLDSQGTFKKYVPTRFPSFDTTLHLYSLLLVFEHMLPKPPPPKGRFVLARTSSLPLNFYTYEIQGKEISNEYQYLWLNSTRLLRSHSGISIKWTPLLHDKSVCFMEMSALQRVRPKIRSFQK